MDVPYSYSPLIANLHLISFPNRRHTIPSRSNLHASRENAGITRIRAFVSGINSPATTLSAFASTPHSSAVAAGASATPSIHAASTRLNTSALKSARAKRDFRRFPPVSGRRFCVVPSHARMSTYGGIFPRSCARAPYRTPKHKKRIRASAYPINGVNAAQSCIRTGTASTTHRSVTTAGITKKLPRTPPSMARGSLAYTRLSVFMRDPPEYTPSHRGCGYEAAPPPRRSRPPCRPP